VFRVIRSRPSFLNSYSTSPLSEMLRGTRGDFLSSLPVSNKL
jgi:hypothetical protein